MAQNSDGLRSFICISFKRLTTVVDLGVISSVPLSCFNDNVTEGLRLKARDSTPLRSLIKTKLLVCVGPVINTDQCSPYYKTKSGADTSVRTINEC